MAEVGSERTILLGEAAELVSQAVGSFPIATQYLLSWLKEELVRWRCTLLPGGKIDPTGCYLPTSGAARSGKYWRAWLEIRWLEHRARGTSLNDAPEVHSVAVVEADVLAQLPDRQIARHPTAPVQVKARAGRGKQSAKVRRLLPKCYPPDGKVSDETTTMSVWATIVDELEKEARTKGVLKDNKSKLPDPPSWDVVNRVLGREDK